MNPNQTTGKFVRQPGGRGVSYWAAIVVTAALAAGTAWILARHSAVARSDEQSAAMQPASPQEMLKRLAALTDSSMRASRPVFLGSRDPSGPSCVTLIRAGELRSSRPNMMGDYNGGPGTTMATLYTLDRQNVSSPLVDLAWHQNRLKTWLDNELVITRASSKPAHELAERTQQFWETANRWTALPPDLKPIGCANKTDWLNFCMTALDQAIAKRDLTDVQRWAGELAAAAFSLDDLHRWLDLLCANHLRALEFQRLCASLFDECNAQLDGKYEPPKSISNFPAGILSLNGWGNYYEVERQAERLFSMPPDRTEEITGNAHLTPASLWVTPGVRGCFLKLRQSLSPQNQATWDQAPRMPYEHSYLINMLFRTASADTDDDVIAVLKKFDASHPHATVGEMLGVIMYRGHSFGGLEWSDRYTPQLRDAADSIPATLDDPGVFAAASKWTNQFYRSNTSYEATFTLKDAIEEKKLDCVRATDMIGAIYRNAGRPRFGNLRISAGTFGHSIAAYLGHDADDKPQTMLVDGLNPQQTVEQWPAAYFHGHAWPAGMESSAKPYAAELYLRGIDCYLWAEGYIIRGPNAGTYMTAGIPFSTHRKTATVNKIFSGPYPQ